MCFSFTSASFLKDGKICQKAVGHSSKTHAGHRAGETHHSRTKDLKSHLYHLFLLSRRKEVVIRHVEKIIIVIKMVKAQPITYDPEHKTRIIFLKLIIKEQELTARINLRHHLRCADNYFAHGES